MSAQRGIEIHSGYIVIPDGMIKVAHLGTAAVPITQTQAGQVVVSAVINAVALGGATRPGLFVINATVTVTGDIIALEAKASIATAITINGYIRGADISAEMLGTSIISAHSLEGIRIAVSAAVGVTMATTDIYGIFMTNYVLCTPGRYNFIRLSENGSAVLNSAFYVRMGGTANINNLFELFPGSRTGWDVSTMPPGGGDLSNPAGAVGRIGVLVGGTQRWIQLYN